MTKTLDMSPATTKHLRAAGWSLACVLIALPAIAMQFDGSGVHWTGGDFLFAAVAVALVGGLLEIAARASSNLAFRLGAAVAVLTGLLTVWSNLAVGIVGEPENPLNLVYFAVIAVACAGAVTAGASAERLTRAMIVTAVVQAFICLVHVADRVAPALAIDAFFALTWFAAGLLFARAARQQASA